MGQWMSKPLQVMASPSQARQVLQNLYTYQCYGWSCTFCSSLLHVYTSNSCLKRWFLRAFSMFIRYLHLGALTGIHSSNTLPSTALSLLLTSNDFYIRMVMNFTLKMDLNASSCGGLYDSQRSTFWKCQSPVMLFMERNLLLQLGTI